MKIFVLLYIYLCYAHAIFGVLVQHGVLVQQGVLVQEGVLVQQGVLVQHSVQVAIKMTAFWSPFSPSIVWAWVLDSGD